MEKHKTYPPYGFHENLLCLFISVPSMSNSFFAHYLNVGIPGVLSLTFF